MAIIKKSKIREMSGEELERQLFELKKEHHSEMGSVARGGRPSNTGKISQLKKAISQIMTIMHEQKLGINVKKENAGKTPGKKKG